MKRKCLFSAPHSFLGCIKDRFNSVIPTEFREIWTSSELTPSSNISVWIVNPGQKFVINKDVLKFFPEVELIITPSTGKNHINEQDCKLNKIRL